MLVDFLAEYDEAFESWDRSRLGGTAGVDKTPQHTQDTLNDVVVSPHAVFIFEDKVLIITKNGQVVEVER